MTDRVADHYSVRNDLADVIAERFRAVGKDLSALTTADLGAIDEFHVRGRKATLELAEGLGLSATSRVLDLGSGLGGPARTLAETYSCHVTGIDLTPAFCAAATALSQWVGLGDKVEFRQGDATRLPFAERSFDAAVTLHVAMNIVAKDKLYAEVHRVLKRGGRFGIYDILQGEGGDVIYPVPWAREPSISHLATPEEMSALLAGAGFKILGVIDSTAQGQSWFEAMAARMKQTGPPPLTFRTFLGDDFIEMTRNQVRNLQERRIRTVSYICEA